MLFSLPVGAKDHRSVVKNLTEAVRKEFIGSERVVRLLVLGFLAGGHVLIEDVPGVGKTTLARSMAAALGLDFGRIQFTPDLLPGDIVGINTWDPQLSEFSYRPGAVMHQFVLADEINRASPRTQSALLEAMQEGQVTVDGVLRRLPDPFFVAATQNPTGYAGTFDLPEGQLDRFLLSVRIGYPQIAEEQRILVDHLDPSRNQNVRAVASESELNALKAGVQSVHVDEKVRRYALSIAERTRNNPQITLGMSPRATIHLLRAGRANAFYDGRDYVLPEDIGTVAVPVLRHRLRLSVDARAEGNTPARLVETILGKLQMPTGLE